MGRKSTRKTRIDDQSRKTEWVRTLLPVLQTRGIRGVSMDQVAKSLGVSKATLYKYFASREALLGEMIDWKLREVGLYRSTLNNPELPFMARFFQALGLASRELTGISNRFLTDLHDLHPALWDRVRRALDEALAALQAYYTEGIRLGAFEAYSPAILIETDRMFFAALADPGFFEKHGLTMRQALQDYFSMKFGGLFRRAELAEDAVEAGLKMALASP